jgi:hypothetical protein
MKTRFNPNRAKFEFGVDRVQKALKNSGVSLTRITTSRNPEVKKVVSKLQVENIPKEFKKWQLPFIFEKSQLYISIGNPDADVPLHSHNEGDGIRVIVSGSIKYGDLELTAGDWMFVPKGKKYSFQVGPTGAVMFYCYCCCCA